MKKDIIIRLENVWKTYRMGDVEVHALRGLSLEVKRGEFLAIQGPSGSGKCILGDNELILEDGRFKKIEDIENEKNVKILALNGKSGKIEPFSVSNFYKRKVESFLEVKTSSGKIIKVTEEHPLFTIDSNGVNEILAKDLQKGTFIATIRKTNIKGKVQYLDSLNNLSKDSSLIIANSANLVKKVFKELKISKNKLCKKLNFNYNTCDSWTYKNNIPLYNFKKILEEYGKSIINYENEIKLTALSSNKKIKIPKNTSPELLELYGFIVGDGNIDKDGLKVTNIDKDIKNRINHLFKKVFGFETKEFISKRIDANNKVLRSFFYHVFEIPLIKKSRIVKLPSFVLKCSNNEIASFIKSLFDCDAFIAKDKKEINITLASKDIIQQISYLLTRFGIVSRYSEKIKFAVNTKSKKKRKYYSLSISGFNNLQLYKDYIGFNSGFKRRRLDKHLLGNSDTNVDVIPCGTLIKAIRKKSGIKFTRKALKLLWPYESGKINSSLKKLRKIIQILSGRGINTEKLEDLINKDIFWDKVISIKKSFKKIFVYDITVPGANNFVANGFIIHNSTAMNMVGCLDIPTKGNVHLEGRNISKLPESDLAQIRGKKIGFIFQQFNLINTLSALENITLPMIFQGIPRDVRLRKAKELLEMVGLGDRIHHKPTELSGGQQQRVAIARSLCNEPEVILADEPTGNLDSKTGENVMQFLQKLHQEKNTTVVMVTHDASLAKHAERIEYLKDGVIIKDKKTKR